MRESFEPLAATYYPVSLGGETVNLPVARSNTTGKLVARDPDSKDEYWVEDERLLVRKVASN